MSIDLLHINCMGYMAGCKDNQFDLAIVDPPYGIGASKPSKKPNKCKQRNGTILNIKSVEYKKKGWDNKPASSEYLKEVIRISKNQIIWGANYYNHPLSGGRIVWDKLNGNTDQYDCEIAYQSFNKRTDIIYYMWFGMFQGLNCSKDIRRALIQKGDKTLNEKRIHPTQKPVQLYKWLLTNYAKEGDTIFDSHGGSMSLAIACHDLNFDATICEIDKDYYDAAVKRFEQHKQQLTLDF